MNKVIIGLIFCLIIVIILVIYLKNNKDTNTSTATNTANNNSTNTAKAANNNSTKAANNNSTKAATTTTNNAIAKSSFFLNKVLRAFNIKQGENFVNENFVNENFQEISTTTNVLIIFNTEDDIKNNIMVFLGYLYHKMNVDKINELLKTYNNNKTMQQILNDNKNKIYIGDIINKVIYEGCLYDEIDDNIIANNVKAHRLILNIVGNINFKNNFKQSINENLAKHNLTLPPNYSDIKYLNLVVSDDFKTSNNINTYYKTNYNEHIKITGDEPQWSGGTNTLECYTSIVCRTGAEINIKVNIQFLKEWAIKNKDKHNTILNLSIVRYLLELNGDTTNIYNDLEKLRQEVYSTRP